MKKFRFRPAYLVLFGLLCLVAVYFLKGDGDEQAPEDRAAVAGFSLPAADASATRAMQAAPSAPAIVREEQGRLPQIVKEPLFDFQPLVGSDTDTPLDTRLSLGEVAKLRFAAHDKALQVPAGAKVTATVTHRGEPEQQLDVEKISEGVFEVPFTPQGPGQFNVVLNVDGVPAGSRTLGVVGAVGATNGADDKLMAADPMQVRARTPGRSRSRSR